MRRFQPALITEAVRAKAYLVDATGIALFDYHKDGGRVARRRQSGHR
jgi:hypothetical protein